MMPRALWAQQPQKQLPNLDGLLCALVLVPTSFSRNRFYSLFSHPKAHDVRRRASRLSSIVRHLSGRAEPKAIVVEERPLCEDRWLLRYRVPEVGMDRTAILDPLEEALLRYALFRAGTDVGLVLLPKHRELVEEALRRLGPELQFD